MLKNLVIFIFIFLLIISSDFDKYITGFRFSKYLIILPSLLLLIKTRTFNFTPIAKTYTFLTLYSLVLYSLGIHQSIVMEEIIIYLGIILVVSSNFLSHVKSFHIIISLLFYFIYVIVVEGIEIKLSGIIFGDFSSIESNVIAFICPILLLFYLTRKKKSFSTFTTLIFNLISIKRITILSLFLILSLKKHIIKYKKMILFLISFLTLGIVVLVGDESNKDFLANYLNISIGLLTMGRSTYYTYLIEGIDWNLTNILFGYGMGYPQGILESFLGKRFLIHNDWLKIFIEQGLLGFLFFIYLIRKIDPIILITLSIWMITDNVIVYFPVIILIQWYDLQKKNNIN